MKKVNDVIQPKPKAKEIKNISIPTSELEMFSKIIALILVGDDREKAIQTHYANMVNGAVKENEKTK